MRAPAAIALLALLAACRSEAPRLDNRQDTVQEENGATLILKRSDPAPDPDPGPDLSGMSPRQRRAYERGLADCRAGRYQPADHPEAYRIGCAAAHDR